MTRRIIGAVFLSLDGVMQAPGGPTEDWTGGFAHGGWMAALGDEGIGDTLGELFGRPFDLLLGRRTYDIFAGYWPFYEGADDYPIAGQLNRAAKRVLTRSDRSLDWENSHRLADLDALAALKETDGPDLLIQGSGTLYPQLLAAGLLDRLTTMTFPVVLGHGKRLFGEGTPPLTLRMLDHQVTAGRTVIATYEPSGPVGTATFAGPTTSAPEHARQAAMEDGSW